MRYTDGVVLVGILLIGWSFYRAHRNPGFEFSLFDLIMENERVSKRAFAFMVALCITSWIVIRLTLDGKMSDGYFIAYGGMWVAPIVAGLFKAESSSTTTITESAKTVEVKT